MVWLQTQRSDSGEIVLSLASKVTPCLLSGLQGWGQRTDTQVLARAQHCSWTSHAWRDAAPGLHPCSVLTSLIRPPDRGPISCISFSGCVGPVPPPSPAESDGTAQHSPWLKWLSLFLSDQIWPWLDFQMQRTQISHNAGLNTIAAPLSRPHPDRTEGREQRKLEV